MLFFHRAKNHRWLIPVAASLACAGVAASYALWCTGGFKSTLLLTLDQRPRPVTADYDYDGYYSLKATELFGDSVVGWFASPTFIAELYQSAGHQLPDDRVSEAVAHFRVKRASAQSVVVRYVEYDRALAQSLATAASQLVSLKASRMNLDAKGQPLFTVRAADLAIAPNDFPPLKAALIGLIFGAFLGAIGLFLATTPKE